MTESDIIMIILTMLLYLFINGLKFLWTWLNVYLIMKELNIQKSSFYYTVLIYMTKLTIDDLKK